jgi:hypothetical protein
MSIDVSISPPGPGGAGSRPAVAATPAAVEFRYTQTESFVGLLARLGASLVVSTYQANKLLVARAAGAGLSTLVRTSDRPMGLAVQGAARSSKAQGVPRQNELRCVALQLTKTQTRAPSVWCRCQVRIRFHFAQH